MTEKKRFTSEEINITTNKYFKGYMELFNHDKISFADYILIKSVITDIQLLFDGDGNE